MEEGCFHDRLKRQTQKYAFWLTELRISRTLDSVSSVLAQEEKKMSQC